MTDQQTMTEKTMLTPEERAIAQFEARLLTRLKERPTADGEVITLDLRSKHFAGAESDRLTLYCPDDAEWPRSGRTTNDIEEATRWVKQRYTSWLWEQVDISKATRDDATLTWRQGAQHYIDRFVTIERRADGTIVEHVPPSKRSRLSLIRRHIIPRFGHLPMTSLDGDTAGKAAESLMVLKPDASASNALKVSASYGTKLNFKAALFAIWKANFRNRRAPFADMVIEQPRVEQKLSTEVFEFDDESELGVDTTGALDMEQLMHLLVAAMWRDWIQMQKPNIKVVMIPNTAHTIALQVGLGPRISELRNIRWGHLNRKSLYARIHNAKMHQVLVEQRATPLQLSLRPWIQELQEMDHRYHPNSFVIRTDPRAPGDVPAAQNTIADRIGHALKLAGLKRPRKETHGLRATYASLLDQSGEVTERMVRRYLGHQRIYGCSTDRYVRQMIAEMKDSHRDIIKLPTPDEVRAQVASFKPVEPAPRRECKKPWGRSKAAKEERQKRPKRVFLGASLDLPKAK